MRARSEPSSPYESSTDRAHGEEAAEALWKASLRKLAEKIAPQNYEMWLRPIRFRSVEGTTIVLQAPNPYVRLWFESNYLAIVLDEIRAETDIQFRVRFEPDPPTAAPLVPPPSPSEPPATVAAAAPAETVPPAAAASPAPSTSVERDYNDFSVPLNPRYTFDTFVSGPSNQLAFAASQAAASTYPPKYNPVFICGGVGLGKTHLLHAIGHHIGALRPGSRVLYMSGERFMNEYIHAIRTNRMHDFRRRYRESCDALLVDDVQFLAGKDGTQDEFFHTFNALHDTHRQIVLTADRKPYEISDIADRLRTRFAWGLLADIDPPELEVRVAILRKKASAEGIHLPDEVALYIASAVKSNVRELEGALIRLAAYASLSRQEISLDFTRQTLEGSITRHPEHVTVERVLKAVAGYYSIKVSDLKSPRRHKSIAAPRAIAMYLARTHTGASYPDLGRAFGGKHHTTVIAAVDKITKRLTTDTALRGEIHAIESILLR